MRTLLLACFLASPAMAFEVEQGVGSFSADDASVKTFGWNASYSGETLGLNGGVKHVIVETPMKEETQGKEYSLGVSVKDETQEANFGLGFNLYDDSFRSTSASLGLSRWVYDQLQLTVKGSKTFVQQPEEVVLRDDLAEIAVPGRKAYDSLSLGARLLLNTVMTLEVTSGLRSETNRPQTRYVNGSWKHYLKFLGLAYHLDAGYAISDGDVSKAEKGELQSQSARGALLYEIWEGGLATVSYRVYKETEKLIETYNYASDLAMIGLEQEWDIASAKVVVTGSAGKYKNNENVDGTLYTGSIGLRF